MSQIKKVSWDFVCCVFAKFSARERQDILMSLLTPKQVGFPTIRRLVHDSDKDLKTYFCDAAHLSFLSWSDKKYLQEVNKHVPNLIKVTAWEK